MNETIAFFLSLLETSPTLVDQLLTPELITRLGTRLPGGWKDVATKHAGAIDRIVHTIVVELVADPTLVADLEHALGRG